MASLETTRGRQIPAWQQANRYYQEPTNYVAEMQPYSQSANTAPATRRRRSTNGSYKIQKGDTLSAIAKRYGTTVQAIAEANGIADVNKIYVGDNLNIPGNTTAKDDIIPQNKASFTRRNATGQQIKPTNTTTTNTNYSNTYTNDYEKRIQTILNKVVNLSRKIESTTNVSQRNALSDEYNSLSVEYDKINKAYTNSVASQRRIDLAKQVGRIPKALSTTNNSFSKSDIAAIRQEQSRRPAVIYNTRSKPSLRRNQRYSRTGNVKSIKYNKNRPRTFKDYQNLRGGFLRDLYD